MLRIVRRLSIGTIVTICLVTFAFTEAQQQAEPAGQAAPAAQGGQQETPGSRPPTADELSQDRCWNRSPCWENRRPPVAFKEDWTDENAGQPYETFKLDQSVGAGHRMAALRRALSGPNIAHSAILGGDP